MFLAAVHIFFAGYMIFHDTYQYRLIPLKMTLEYG